MLKTRKKWISILLTLAMLVGLMVPLATPALAGTTYSAITTIPSADPANDATSNLQLSKVQIKIDPATDISDPTTNPQGLSSALIQVKDSNGSLLNILNGSSAVKGNLESVPAGATKSKTWKYSVNAYVYNDEAGLKDGTFTDNLTLYVDAKGKASGDITVEFFNAEGQLMNGTVVAATLIGGKVEISTVDSGTWGDSGGKVTIRLKETSANGLSRTAKSLKFRLPAGFTWSDTWKENGVAKTATATVIAGSAAADQSGAIDIQNDGRDLVLDFSGLGGTDKANTIDVTAYITVDDLSVAQFGAVNATVSGDSTVSTDTLKVGTYGDYGITVAKVDTKDVISGKFDQEIGKFSIDEGIKESLLANRTIILTLPEEAKWSGTSYPSISSGDSKDLGGISISEWTQIGNDGRSIKATVTGSSTAGGGAFIVFKGGKITVAADYTGPISLEVSGSAGASGTVEVANAVAPVEVAASATPDVVIGTSSVAAGDIIITEKAAEAIRVKTTMEDGSVGSNTNIIIEAPSGVTFAAVPSVEVTEGDLQLGTISKASDDTYIKINVKSTSSKPSTIKISDIKLIIDRTVPEGAINLKVGGGSLVENAADEDYFPNNQYVAEVPVANVVTPAPVETKATAQFVIGQTTFTLNGVEQTMDVAPYIKDGRTFLPIRYVAAAVGVSNDNIYWDGTSAILMKGDKVVSFKIGEKAISINGITVPTDAAAEISNDRTMVPMRAIVQAFGAQVGWDEATQTVTVN